MSRREHHRLCLRCASANAWFVMICNRRAVPGDAGVQTLSPQNLQAAAGFLRAARAAEFASASHRS